MLDLHFWPTPNGKKVTILLEELGVPYRVVPCNIGAGDQFTAEFLKINPNHRMPVLVDNEPAGGGEPVSVFESGAIMLYLAEKFGKFLPADLRGRTEVTQWLIWQMANQGPKSGECGHFRRLGDTKGDQSYAVTTIADMICYPWTANWAAQGQDINEFAYFKRWQAEIAARPAVQRGMAVGSDLQNDPSKLSAEEQARRAKMLYNQCARPAPAGGLL